MSALLEKTRKAAALSLAASQSWRSADHRLGFLMRLSPQPLVAPDRRIVLLWSAKSACSSALIWFYKVTGQLAAAQAYHPNPHNYRIERYAQSAEYRRALRGPFENAFFVRIVRDPYERAVSSYRHALRFGYEDAAIARRLGRAVTPETGFSFAEFLDHVAALDIARCNPHHRRQRHPLEAARAPDRVINVSRQDLLAELNAVEAALGMARTDFAALPWIAAVEGRRRAGAAAFSGDASTTPLSRRCAAPGGGWPGATALLTPDRRREIASIYQEDIEAYGASSAPQTR